VLVDRPSGDAWPYGSAMALPTVERLTVGRVRAVPPWHPEHGSFDPFPVHAWLVRHAGGALLVDTGIGPGHPQIDEWYRPEVVPLADALAVAGLAPADIGAVVLTHLHFDHCGQQRELEAPVFVQAAEHAEAQRPAYTVAAWADIPRARLRTVDGDDELAPGVAVLATPGHTPGHQSVVVETADRGRVVIGGQCAFRAGEVRSGEPAATNLHDDTWLDAARASLARVRALAPTTVELSHDAAVVELG
jgi:N-acyl homoserine lactone hydrolase